MIRAWIQRRRRREELLVLGALTYIRPTELSALPLGQATRLGPGRVHAVLARLERAGFVSSRWVDGPHPRRRIYRLTETEN